MFVWRKVHSIIKFSVRHQRVLFLQPPVFLHHFQVERRVVAQLALAHENAQLVTGSTVRLLVDNFGDENVSPKLKLSIRKLGHKDFVDLSEPLSNASPLSYEY